MREEFDSKIKLRLRKFYLILFIFSGLLVLASARWQILKASEFKEIAKNKVYSSDLKSLRGTIYSEDGTALAYSEPRFNMFIWYPDLEFFEKQKIQSIDEFVRKVAPIIDTTPEALHKKIDDFEDKKIKWMPIAESLTEDQWRRITNLKTDISANLELRGFKFERTEKRLYPENQLAAHIVGLTQTHNNTTYGISGIEESWDGDLSPQNGIVVREDDASGKALASALVPTIEPKPGSEIYTSINKKLQTIVERELKDVVVRYGAESGSVVIMDPKTGQIKALANFPTYNPNTRESTKPETFGNSSLLAPVEIGSVMKVITIASVIDKGLITPETVVMPDGHLGCKEYPEFGTDLGALCTWNKAPQPPMPASECFRKSDNICFYEMAKLLDRNNYHDYLTKFGVGRTTGADLGTESIGYLKDTTEWTAGDVSALSYGHGVAVNMLQVIAAVAAIPNKGVRMQPYVVTKVVKSDGTIKYQNPVVVERAVSKETANTVSAMMENNFQSDVVEDYLAYLKQYPIGWKTGSALIADPNNPLDPYAKGELNNTIVGFDASENATFIMLVKLEKPKGGLSFYNVRPAWLQIFDASKETLGVKPRQ